MSKKTIQYIDNNGTFQIRNPEEYSYLYLPVAGEDGLKSSFTPLLGGDAKISQERFLLEPVSVENLHNNRNTRNFWCITKKGAWSACGSSAEAENNRFTKKQDSSTLTGGFMWQKLERKSDQYDLSAEITSFVPVHLNAEVMHVKITNTSDKKQKLQAIAVVPVYGRSADNIRDHRNVTSMLHRIRTTETAIIVKPTMSFDERGHQKNNTSYYVLASEGKVEGFYPSVDDFLKEGGTFTHPGAVYQKSSPLSADTREAGIEAAGAIQFQELVLKPNESATFTILAGITEDETVIDQAAADYSSSEKVLSAFEETKKYWVDQVNISFHTGSRRFDELMRWVGFQPIIRRVYGCSFLPHHDYGRGGRGWRDLWQDCLSLLLMNPDGVHDMILNNCGGVRFDGTNATIIGDAPGEFKADRNGIARVWMDHGMWPLMTVKFYIDQTGDLDILKEQAPYFKDHQVQRGTEIDHRWNEKQGTRLKSTDGSIYSGTVLEHLLIENLTSFYEVGKHGIIRLRGADWNDALDMADANGESTAFTFAYAGNLNDLADLIGELKKNGVKTIETAEEVKILLDPKENETPEEKQSVLKNYMDACHHEISGKKISIPSDELEEVLRRKSQELKELLKKQEWLEEKNGEGWYNSYYDNHCNRVEGIFDGNVRMMLTGQVFAIMSGTADESQIKKITKAADHYLYDKKAGGYRLNTDFHELKMDMGRMFGFAYGEKENGAVFSHMDVMYANALYRRGFIKEGYKGLQSLADEADDFDKSRIYPGIPEYFDNNGRGKYHYLTGAASWYLMTEVIEAFGVRGELGDLVIRPCLVKQQFSRNGKASICLIFQHKPVEVIYLNPEHLDYGEYEIKDVKCREASCHKQKDHITITKNDLDKAVDTIHISVTLGRKEK